MGKPILEKKENGFSAMLNLVDNIRMRVAILKTLTSGNECISEEDCKFYEKDLENIDLKLEDLYNILMEDQLNFEFN